MRESGSNDGVGMRISQPEESRFRAMLNIVGETRAYPTRTAPATIQATTADGERPRTVKVSDANTHKFLGPLGAR